MKNTVPARAACPKWRNKPVPYVVVIDCKFEWKCTAELSQHGCQSM